MCMGRKVAAGLAFFGVGGFVVVGGFAGGAWAAGGPSPRRPAAGPGAAPVDLPSLAESTDAGPATKAAPQGVETVPVRQKSAAGKKPPVPGKAPDSPKGEPAAEKSPAAGED